MSEESPSPTLALEEFMQRLTLASQDEKADILAGIIPLLNEISGNPKWKVGKCSK